MEWGSTRCTGEIIIPCTRHNFSDESDYRIWEPASYIASIRLNMRKLHLHRAQFLQAAALHNRRSDNCRLVSLVVSPLHRTGCYSDRQQTIAGPTRITLFIVFSCHIRLNQISSWSSRHIQRDEELPELIIWHCNKMWVQQSRRQWWLCNEPHELLLSLGWVESKLDYLI